jgi:uncharacterized protein YjiS (DUF1127 family)
MPKPITSVGFPNATSAPLRAGGRAIVSTAIQTLNRGLRWYRNRKALREIAALDDRLLDDLGLTRADVERAILTAGEHDPAQMLADARFENGAGRFRR